MMNGGDFLEVSSTFALLIASKQRMNRPYIKTAIEKKMRNLHDMQDSLGCDRLQCNVWCITFMDHVKVDEKVCAQVDLACIAHTTKRSNLVVDMLDIF